MDVGAWLRELGLAKYEQAFRANDVDAEILADLTAEDLSGLGITSVGHRRKLLAAIAALRHDAASSNTSVPNVPSVASTMPLPVPGAERRLLTVMFVDLVDSTALATRLDPEEMSELLQLYQSAVAGAIARFEGHIAKYMGDGVLAYFGYPRAHEDEAERAVRAGLATVEAVRGLGPKPDLSLAVRVGIATGGVVVGELIGTGEARERSVVGQTPNLAARLQSLAEPNRVVISRNTRRLIGGLFEVADLGFHDFKGFAGPVHAWRVVGESQAESRFEALRAAGLTPLVGREEELALLQRRWNEARDGEGQVVLLSGEPGIGKSRLTRALQEQLDERNYTRIVHLCSPYYASSALHPTIDRLRRAARFGRDDTDEQKLAKLEELLALATENVPAVAPFFATLMSIPTGERYPPLNLAPDEQMSRTLDALVAQVEGLARRRPVLALFEDVHWIDPTSLELLERLIERVRSLRVLLVITFRPEFKQSWIGHPHVMSLTLSRLSRRSGSAMIEQLTSGKALPDAVLDQIVARTDGVPLFVEELTRAVLEANLLKDEGDHYALIAPLPALAIPTTLQESLLARLDRLVPARAAAQVAAAIGREFSHELLAAAASMPESELQEALDDLVESGLVFRRGTPPQATYSFKHALVRDAAYATLVRAKRQRLHAGIADALAQNFPGIAQAQPELLAHHYTEAGQTERATIYWLQAGQRAFAHSAMAEALAQLRKGLELLATLPGSDHRRRLEVDLQIALSVALMAVQGWAAPEAGSANARARELCEQIGATAQLWPVLYGQWVFHAVRAEHNEARERAADFLRLARHHQDAAATVVAHRVVGTGALLRGELTLARTHLDQALALYEPERHRSLAFLYVQDPKVAALAALSWMLFVTGHAEQARARSDEALADAQGLSHRNTLAYALLYGGILSQLRGDRREARERADALIALAREQASPHFLGAGTVVRGWTAAAAGEFPSAKAQIREGIASWQATGANFLMPYFLSLLALVEERAGHAEEGLTSLAEALRRVAETGERWFAAELHRLIGELTLQLPSPNFAMAEARFREAVAIASEQGSKLWELRASTSLARLLIKWGRRGEVEDLLVPICSEFTEGDEPIDDLQAAHAVLSKTSPGPT